MKLIPIPYEPVQGKTYSLFGKNDTTSGYYLLIKDLTRSILEKWNDPKSILLTIQSYSKRKSALRRMSSGKDDPGVISFILRSLNKSLSNYTENVELHLKNLPVTRLWDRSLSTTREQYHLYMLEIELSNLINANKFRPAEKKIALLPHCLRDFSVDCKSAPDAFDYQCKHCSENCFENYLSRLLEENNIDPYIWMSADIKEERKRGI